MKRKKDNPDMSFSSSTSTPLAPKQELISMHNMERPYREPPEKFPKHQVPNTTVGTSGITYSVEVEGSVDEGRAELDVLKCILNREAYIARLIHSSRTVSKKFKPEIADLLDFVRVATLDVVDAIVRWRETKSDHHAAFMWNGVNYLLKMSSDLDFLDSFKAIRVWMGFKMTRNPFCVPLPMENGSNIFSERILDPRHTDPGSSTDGFYIGGISQASLRKKYGANSGTIGKKSEKPSPYLASASSSSLKVGTTDQQYSGNGVSDAESSSMLSNLPSTSVNFVLNSDMSRIRQAEMIILKEEEKFGRFSRDPEGRIVPDLQAYSRRAALELCKDDKRSMEEPSHSTQEFAVHAENCEVGVVEESWIPGDSKKNALLESSFLAKSDQSVDADKRGESKIGGALSALTSKSEPTRLRKPLKPSLASQAEFHRVIKRKSLSDRLAEISSLREEISKAKLSLFSQDASSNDSVNKSNENTGFRKTATAFPKKGKDKDALSSISSVAYDQNDSYDHSAGLHESMETTLQKKFIDRSQNTIAELGATVPIHDLISSKKATTNEKFIDEGRNKETRPGKKRNHSQATKDSRQLANQDVSTFDDIEFPENAGISSKAKNNQTAISENFISRLDKLQEIESDLQELNLEYHSKKKELDNIQRDDEQISTLKEQERWLKNREKSREIERKRRLLTEEEGSRKGPPPNDPPNVYDYYATRIQALIRGFITRCFAKWFRRVSTTASIQLQKIVRGGLGRLRVKRIRVRYKAATDIQRNFRGWKTRGASAALVRQKNFVKSAVLIQRIYRGFLGKKRVASKRSLDAAAQKAMNSMDPRHVHSQDIRELGRRILNAVEEPTTPYPPDEVLHLIRIAALIVQGARGSMGLSEYDFLNRRFFEEVEGTSMSWFDASRLLNRAERFLRIVRALAFGPGAKPPRLIQIPAEATRLYEAQCKNPLWSVNTFENMGQGSKFCVQMFEWLSSIIEISSRQQEFLMFLASNFPDWLPKLYEIQASMRKCEMDRAINDRCMEVLNDEMSRNNLIDEDPALCQLLEKEILLMTKENEESVQSWRSLRRQQDKLKEDQSSREKFAKISLEERLQEQKEVYENLAKEYQSALQGASEEDRGMIAKLPDLRIRLTNQKLIVNEMESQWKLLVLECEKNEERRKDAAKLAPDLAAQCQSIGEAKALYLQAVQKTRLYLRSSGVKHPQELADSLVEMYLQLEGKENKTKSEYRLLHFHAENFRRAFDEDIMVRLHEMQEKDCKSKDQMIPSELELQEERQEDEREAVLERVKKLQFVSDDILKAPKKRPRPVIVALSRDLPGSVQLHLHQEITRELPGVFVTLNETSHCGFNVRDMQTILDADKSIILYVDPGLTRVSRQSFIEIVEISIKTLIPRPFLILALGDEKNKSFVPRYPHCGVPKSDLQILRDGDIKACLEILSITLDELSSFPFLQEMRALSIQMNPPSLEMLLVLEAVFILHSIVIEFPGASLKALENGSPLTPLLRSPTHAVAAISWRVTHLFLSQPETFLQSLRSLSRGILGKNLMLLECMHQYISHPRWPLNNDPQRLSQGLLHNLAKFVEEWALCERLTVERGGLPSSLLTKSTLKGVQTVVVVRDAVDSLDILTSLHSSTPTSSFSSSSVTTSSSTSACCWKMASARILRSALQDLRMMKSVKKINNHLYNICAYRENSRIYFDAYNPVSSDVYWTSIDSDHIPNLLTPNALHKLERNEKMLNPPATFEELYSRLLSLVKIEKSSSDPYSRHQLVCKRDYTFLEKITTVIDGHTCFLSCYEAALGELYFSVELPLYAAWVDTKMGLDMRISLLEKSENKDERPCFDSEDAKRMLPFIRDRLRITPSYVSTVVRGLTEVKDGRFQDRLFPPKKQRSQGFSLKIRIPGGIGKTLFKQIVVFSRVKHLVTVRRCFQTNDLHILAYEPMRQHSMSTCLSDFHRRLLFAANTDAYRLWKTDLLSRLKLDWKGRHELIVDLTICRGIRRVGGRRLSIEVCCPNNETVSIRIQDFAISTSFSTILSRIQLIQLLHVEPPIDAVEKQFGVRVENDHLRQILQSMKERNSLTQSREDNENSLKASDSSSLSNIPPSVLAIPMLEIFASSDIYQHILTKLAFVLKVRSSVDRKAGYFIENPFQCNFSADLEDKNSQERLLNTQLRFETTLKIKDITQDMEGFDRSRRQFPMIVMEDELNNLVHQQALQAMKKIEEDLKAAEDMEEKIAEWDEHRRSDHEESQSIADDESAQISNASNGTTFDHIVEFAATAAKESLLETLEQKERDRNMEREAPGSYQQIFIVEKKNQEEKLLLFGIDGQSKVEVDSSWLSQDERAILGLGEVFLFEGGLKTTYREGKARWSGHVSLQVYETMCWMGDDGVGRRLRFVVYEPNCCQYFEGVIRNSVHLREVLGLHGQDLLDKKRTKEMIIFVVKYRMEVVKFSATYDGVEEASISPPLFRIEFQNDKLYSSTTKVTPVNAGGDEDEKANLAKLMDLERARGKKLLRMVRRVSGILLQLTVFEVPTENSSRDANENVDSSNRNTQDSAVAKTAELSGMDRQLALLSDHKELAENRISTGLPRFAPPTFRIVGYDPRTKRKTVSVAVPEAILEVAGGIYSPFLDPIKRRDLANIVCESLVLYFPRGKDFEIIIPWSGSHKSISNAIANADRISSSWKSSAERIFNRTGKLFRSGLRISKLECVVTVYSNELPRMNAQGESLDPELSVVVNLYAQRAAEAQDLFVSEKDQVLRLGRPIVHFAEGSVRAAAIRRFCRFLKAEMVVDPEKPDKKVFNVELLAPNKGYLTEYDQVKPALSSDSAERPVGYPSAFLPLDTCGYALYRRGMTIANRDTKVESKEYMVNIFTKSQLEHPERGLVIKLYERGSSYTGVLHVGPSELYRQCEINHEFDLLKDLVKARDDAESEELDEVEQQFETLTDKGMKKHRYKQIVNRLVEIVMNDLGIWDTADGKFFPYFKSRPQGIPPC